MKGEGSFAWGTMCGLALAAPLFLFASSIVIPTEWNSFDHWFGENGILGVVLGILTLGSALGAGIGIYLNNRRSLDALEFGRKAELSTRFQKGVELLESQSAATRAGSLLLLRDVALADPSVYYLPTIAILGRFITEESGEGVDDTGADVESALNALSDLRVSPQRRALETKPFAVGRIRTTLQLRDLYLGHMTCPAWEMGRPAFLHCDLTNASIKVASQASSVQFVDCEMSGAEVQVFAGQCHTLLRESNLSSVRYLCPGGDVTVETCNLTAAYISSRKTRTAGCWHASTAPTYRFIPEPPPPDLWPTSTEVSHMKRTGRLSSFGMPIYQLSRS